MKRFLATTHPKIAGEWDREKNGELTPSNVTFGSGRKVWWLCDKGHSYQTQVANRTKKMGGTGCPVCRGTQVSADNNLLVKFPSVAAQWHKTKNGERQPQDYRPKSGVKVWWQCDRYEEHEWEAASRTRTNSGSGCPKCGVSTSLPN